MRWCSGLFVPDVQFDRVHPDNFGVNGRDATKERLRRAACGLTVSAKSIIKI